MIKQRVCIKGSDTVNLDIEFKNDGEDVSLTNRTGNKCRIGHIEDLSSSLESEAEYRARKRSHWIIYTTILVMAIGFSIILTGVWPYLQKLDPHASKEYLGWVVAANPLGQMLMAPILGFWANKLGTNRPALYCTVLMYIVGNVLYSILSIFGSYAKIIMILSRFIVGVSAGNLSLCSSYIAASTTLSERTTALTLSTVAQLLGFMIGPALQTAIAVSFSYSSDANVKILNCTINNLGNTSNIQTGLTQGLEWNMFTATGWIAALLGFINFIILLPCIFQEHNIADKEAKFKQQQRSEKKKEAKLSKPDYLAVICVLVAVFVILLVFVLLETIAVPMVIDMYAWTSDFALKFVGFGMVIASFIMLFTSAIGSKLSKLYDERKVVIFLGLIPAMLSMLFFFPMGSNYAKIQNCTAEASLITFPINFTTPLTILNNSNKNISVHEELSRSKNFVIDGDGSGCNKSLSEDECHLGCPQNQVWCLYTPIVEIWQMAISVVTASIGYPVAISILKSIYSKILGPKPLGVWMGILTSVGSFSRILGPIFVTNMYTKLGTRWTFGSLFSILALTVLIVSLFYKRLVPMKLESGEHTEPLQE